jgi:hypothetical protein
MDTWDDDERSLKNLSFPNSSKYIEDEYYDLGEICKEITKTLNNIEYIDNTDTESESEYDEYYSDEEYEFVEYDFREFDKPTYCSTFNRSNSFVSITSCDSLSSYENSIPRINSNLTDLVNGSIENINDLTGNFKQKFFDT